MTLSNEMYDLARAAIYWWTAKRPQSWSSDQHHDNPTINCADDVERELAVAVANLPRNGHIK